MVIAAAANNPELGRLFYENGIRQGTALMERYFESVITAGKLRGAWHRRSWSLISVGCWSQSFWN